MNILVTGHKGFIGSNLVTRLKAETAHEIRGFDRENTPKDLEDGIQWADIIFHLAAVNRTDDEDEFERVNHEFTQNVLRYLVKNGKKTPLIYVSSIQAAGHTTPYGLSKWRGELATFKYHENTGAYIAIYRLPNIFGKWCRPNYNSVVATFCHNISHDLPIEISDAYSSIGLIYVDDVVDLFIAELSEKHPVSMPIKEKRTVGGFNTSKMTNDVITVPPTKYIMLGDLAKILRSFKDGRDTRHITDFTDPFIRQLYATYISYIDPDKLLYDLDAHQDDRGVFVEFMKSVGGGQISISTTLPGEIRGGHWHNTKTEKFFVLSGTAVITLRHIITGAEYAFEVRDLVGTPKVVDIPPGHQHWIKNIGNTPLIVLLWADEMFDHVAPDTFS